MLGLCTLALAECVAPETQRITSPNGGHVLVIEADGRFVLDGSMGKIDAPGHHWEVFLFNSGHFVIADPYERLVLFDAAGQELESHGSGDLSYWRTGRWACHPEGQWFTRGVWEDPQTVVLDVRVGPNVRIRSEDGAPRVLSSFFTGQTRLGSSLLILGAGAAAFLRRRALQKARGRDSGGIDERWPGLSK